MSAALDVLSTRHGFDAVAREPAANEPVRSDLSTAVLLRTAELLGGAVVSADTLSESARELVKHIEDARQELESKMMRLVAD